MKVRGNMTEDGERRIRNVGREKNTASEKNTTSEKNTSRGEVIITCTYPLTNRDPVTRRIAVNSWDEPFLKICREAEPAGRVFTFDRYYGSSEMMTLGKRFPYIVRDGHVLWNVPYEEVTVREFYDTHGLDRSDEVTLEIDNIGSAGELFETLYQAWIAFLPVLEEALDWGGRILTAWELICLVKRSFGKRKEGKPQPEQLSKYLLKRETWDLQELCRTLDADPELIGNFLTAMGYEDRAGIYVRDPKKAERVKKLLSTPPQALEDDHGLDINCYSINQAVYEINLDLTYLTVLCQERRETAALEELRPELEALILQNSGVLEQGALELRLALKEQFPSDFSYGNQVQIWGSLSAFQVIVRKTIQNLERLEN